MIAGAAAMRLGRPLVRLGLTESTNDVARCLAAAGVPEGAVVVAARQTKGRGRLGRAWQSPEGGLWCSIVLRPVARRLPGLLSLAAGLAVAEAIEVAADLQVGLKWPNDVLLGDRKVGGILIEGTADAVIVGIGINVRVSSEDLPPDLAATATSIHLMAARSVEPAGVLASLLERFAVWYRCWLEGGDIVGAWSQRDVLQGRRVAVRLSGEVLQGTADGLESDGALRLKEASGQLRRVRSGDVVFARETVPDQRNAKGGSLWNPSAPRSP